MAFDLYLDQVWRWLRSWNGWRFFVDSGWVWGRDTYLWRPIPYTAENVSVGTDIDTDTAFYKVYLHLLI